MRKTLKVAATCLLMGMFLSPIAAMAAPNDNANDTANLGPDNASGRNPHSTPEIHPVAAGAVGILVVGGIALLTTRRRAHATKI
jgi:hypothetical protein